MVCSLSMTKITLSSDTSQRTKDNEQVGREADAFMGIKKQIAAEAKKRPAATLKQNQATVVEIFPQREQGTVREVRFLQKARGVQYRQCSRPKEGTSRRVNIILAGGTSRLSWHIRGG